MNPLRDKVAAAILAEVDISDWDAGKAADAAIEAMPVQGWPAPRPIHEAKREFGEILGYQATPGDNEGQFAVCWAFGPLGMPPIWLGQKGLVPTHFWSLPSLPVEER